MRRYLVQLTTFLASRSVEVADTTLRQLARWLTSSTDVRVVAGVERHHIEDYKVWLATQPGRGPRKTLAKNTQRHRLRMIRIFLEQLIEWDWPDAPGRNPILHGDIPPRSEPIPKFLTDQQAAQFIAAARAHPVARYRLVAQVLARTGLRASDDAVAPPWPPPRSPHHIGTPRRAPGQVRDRCSCRSAHRAHPTRLPTPGACARRQPRDRDDHGNRLGQSRRRGLGHLRGRDRSHPIRHAALNAH